MECYTIKNGVKIPVIGYGTWRAAEDGTDNNIYNALMEGYRHIDSAAFYHTEPFVKTALERSGLKREDVFITTKLWKTDLGYESAHRNFRESLERLGTDYVDLYMMHWPRLNKHGDEWLELDIETWKAFEEIYESGQARVIGVCNFLPHHLENLSRGARIMPMVNQIEFHPGYSQLAVLDYCRKSDILVEAWSPIGQARLLADPFINEIASSYHKTVAQICVRYALQCGVLPLPRSKSVEHMRDNKDVFDFELSAFDMSQLMCFPQTGWSGEHPDRDRIPMPQN